MHMSHSLKKSYQETFLESKRQTWELQKDLVTLAKSGRMRKVEVFYPNEYYGLDLIVKNFLNLNPKESLKFAIPHGVELNDSGLRNVFGFNTNVSTLTYNNDIGLSNMLVHKVPGWKIKTEHPFLILKQILFERGLLDNNPTFGGVLFFPPHLAPSQNFIDDQFDAKIIQNLIENRFNRTTITVSLPSADILRGRYLLYEKYGFKVVSAGSIFDARFLNRFINLVMGYDQILTSAVGSHMVFARALKKEIRFHQIGPDLSPQTFDKNGIVPKVVFDSYVEKFISKLEDPDSYYQALNLLGSTGELSSQELWKSIYTKSKFNDYFGFFEPCPERKKMRIPRAYSRLARKIIN